MNIGQASKATGLSIKQIRDYEKLGLLSNTSRTSSGYRIYDNETLIRLKFIAKARGVGFSLAQIGELLALQDNPYRKSCEVKALANTHIEFLSNKIKELEEMKTALGAWCDACRGDDMPECPILQGLGG
ncbi:Cu(I)-responsive transcriptional regulator [Actinobacillus pleuropneumoniae]|uniref:MerR family transcriptional regulator, heavy metal-dependent n=2 Tax=Actinobacillus TaxID=713 RepID=C5S1V6_9PAST|nr:MULTISPECIES: Cu(I)-responsive transcriptional regulator [Pasteurellaceae]QOF68057.1 Cu(I)-responsive transcriptional regulator [Actinobacillus sp. GY-402]HDV7284606.1 Cu(I)-responsive transcriptional regulator [Mannheimia haemolytica]EER47059.1 MerR family transcriptional regulator, heavy metal-dependent [Actinobacillus minor NM305]MCI5764471.1 Cu(I)-responsive transcriptional regulator [Actinobacillus porcinus]MDG2943841.1 Cu(I)-responsive transcriptional regulator [Exercitatus varius]